MQGKGFGGLLGGMGLLVAIVVVPLLIAAALLFTGHWISACLLAAPFAAFGLHLWRDEQKKRRELAEGINPSLKKRR